MRRTSSPRSRTPSRERALRTSGPRYGDDFNSVASDFRLYYNNEQTREMRVAGAKVTSPREPGQVIIQFRMHDRKGVLRNLWLPSRATLPFAGAPNVTASLELGKEFIFHMTDFGTSGRWEITSLSSYDGYNRDTYRSPNARS